MTAADALASGPAEAEGRAARQPYVGVAGLAVVAAVVVVLGIVPGPETALQTVIALITFALPVVVAVAVWWQGWPSARLGRPLGGLSNTVLFAASALVLGFAGLAIVGKASVAGLFATAPDMATGRLPVFPFGFVLAATVFTVMLQLTFVCGMEPLGRLGQPAGGLVALVLSWAIGLVLYLTLLNWDAVPPPARDAIGLHNPGGPVDALNFVGFLLCVVLWQVTLFILLGGKPFTQISSLAPRLLAANVATIGGGWLTYLLLFHGLDWTIPTISAVGGCVAAAVLLQAMLFETWPVRGANAVANAVGLLASAAILTVALFYGLKAIGNAVVESWTQYPVELWVAGVGLNLIATFVIVHYAVWGRWPLAAPQPPPT